MVTRRKFIQTTALAGLGATLPWTRFIRNARGQILAAGLSDPALQPKFVELAPNALDPGFLYKDFGGTPSQKPNFTVKASKTKQETGLINPSDGKKLTTDLWGYGQNTVSWPGQTIQVVSSLGGAGGADETVVQWDNKIQDKQHLLPVDVNLHWCYSLHGASSANGVDYTQFSIEKDGVPIITHLHGGNTDFQYDGNPEFFYSPNNKVIGPQWDFVPGGFTNTFRYNNAVPAGNLWYHDHALGITRLNVYAGLAGFYFVRDENDTGLPDNPLGLPAFPYELAYAIQDRMFRDDGALFYPAFPGDPFYADFIYGEGAMLPPDLFPGGGPTALAEFFGDHMVVNGKIWPKADVEPRHYRMRLLNGCDSRFLVIRFRQAASLTATDLIGAGEPIPFYVIGSDQGLASAASQTDVLVIENGSRYDIVVDFADLQGSRVIMENIGYDAPFGGDFGPPDPDPDVFPNRQTDRIMAFDVTVPLDTTVSDAFDSSYIGFGPNIGNPTVVRKVALFEGKDEFGRLQPLLGIVDSEPNVYGSYATPYTWFQPTTEEPVQGTTEEWEIYNFTGDAHPVHLHLVNFEILGRYALSFTSDDGEPGQPVLQHNDAEGRAPIITDIDADGDPINLGPSDGYVENAPQDMVTALPEQITRIKATFDKTGRYVWHCHILSHEDHEMMRVLEVVPPP
jgi:spore coat protein A